MHQSRLAVELLARGLGRFAIPVVEIVLERDAQGLDLGCDLLADVEAVGQLAAEDRDDAFRVVDLDGVLPTQLGPVDVFLIALAGVHDERADPAPLGDDVGAGERTSRGPCGR